MDYKEAYNGFHINLIDKITSNPLSKLKEYFYNKFHFLGNLLGIKCRRCGHPTSSHTSINSTSWRCQDCDENKNICSILEEETWEKATSFIENLKKSIE